MEYLDYYLKKFKKLLSVLAMQIKYWLGLSLFYININICNIALGTVIIIFLYLVYFLTIYVSKKIVISDA